MPHVQIIIGSVRAVRIGDQIGAWAIDTLSSLPGLSFELLDLKDWPLPLDDEPEQPKHGHRYLQLHTRQWSEKIAGGDGYVFLTPQYNWGYPAALKNALDHLYHEWSGKPALIVSYGHRGGVKAAAQLREVLTGLHLRTAPEAIPLTLGDITMTPRGRIADPMTAFAAYSGTLRNAVSAMMEPHLEER